MAPGHIRTEDKRAAEVKARQQRERRARMASVKRDKEAQDASPARAVKIEEESAEAAPDGNTEPAGGSASREVVGSTAG